VLARANLLTYLKKECEERGATIIYATHIFDGLDDWPTHLVSFLAIYSVDVNQETHALILLFMLNVQVYIAHGKLQLALPLEKVKQMSQLSLMVSSCYVTEYILSTS
jgi:CCR4-NOT complex subunit CAF16